MVTPTDSDHRIVQYWDQYQQPAQIHWPAYYLHQRGQADYYYGSHLSGMLNGEGHPKKSLGTGEEQPALVNPKGVYRRNEIPHRAYPSYPYYYPPVYEAESSNANSTSVAPTKKPVNRDRVEFLKSMMVDFFRVTRSFG